MDTSRFEKVDDYLVDLFTLSDNTLHHIEQSIKKNGMPEQSISANQGQFLSTLVSMLNAKNILEIGTLAGYSTVWLARAISGVGKVTTIEINPAYAKVAKQNIDYAKLSDTVDIIVGDGIEIMKGLKNDGQLMDLIFIDGDKTKYIEYFETGLKLSRPGTLIIADNVIRDGEILNSESTDEKVIGVQNYLEMLSKTKKVKTSIIQQVGHKRHDGIAISIVI